MSSDSEAVESGVICVILTARTFRATGSLVLNGDDLTDYNRFLLDLWSATLYYTCKLSQPKNIADSYVHTQLSIVETAETIKPNHVHEIMN